MPINMHPKTPPTLISFSLRTLGAAVASAVLCSAALAAGLGKLTVLSSLGEPLRAEIELSSTSQDDAGSLVAKLAPTEAYRQAKIDFNPVLLSLRFAIVQRGGRKVISMTSTQPINEPFVDVLLELGGNKGRLTREYTFLLDPVDLRLGQNAQTVTPVAAPGAAELGTASPAPAPELAAQESAARARNPVSKGRSTIIEDKKTTSYRVKSGDTLTLVALKFKPESISLDQMLVALYRANPNGFVSNNMNRMRAGFVLSVPDSNTTSNVPSRVASGIVIAQAADFNAYRNQLASKVTQGAAKSSTVMKKNAQGAQNAQSAVGKVETKVEETQAGVSVSKDKLQLSKANALAGNPARQANGTTPGGENTIAADKALAEASARITILEKNLSDLQKLLEIKNKALTEQQLNAQTAQNLKAKSPATPALVAPVVPAAPVATVAPAAPAATVAPLPAPAASTTKTKIVAAEPPAKASFMDQLLDNPLLLPVAGILIAILGAFGIYSNRRRKKPHNKFDDSTFAASSLQTNSLFGSTGGQSVDTNNSVFNSSFAPSASQLDANEVDPVAEADVYIAYGRDAQAEEILKEALRTQPDRHPVRLKLLEIYASRKDLRSFEALASELYGMTKGETDEWQQAARLGAALDPNNPLYAGGALPGEAAAKAVALGEPTLPLEELYPEAILTNSQSHVGVESAKLAFEDIAPGIKPKLDSVASTNSVPDYIAEAENSISNGLDFDLGEIAEAASETDVDPAKDKEPDDISIDFVTESLVAPTMPEKAVEAAPISIFPKFDLDEVDFDFLGNTATNKTDAAQHPELPLEDVAHATLPIVNAEIEAETEASVEPATPGLELDLSGFDLHFDPIEPPSASTQDNLDQVAPIDAGAGFGNIEMSTKLDLAIAYQEIGDKEGARELLNEVLIDGTAAQIEKAKTLLAELA
ncbi:MAG: FimV family protein [Glaciimonas sp.]|nr:FimV family protein [Glaciimonas sp.]